jgi:predicted negative regulator of RcsB-dependent stress response
MESDIAHTGQLYSFLGWLDKNRRQIISTSIVLALVGIVIAFVVWRNDQKEVAAGEALSSVMLAGNTAGDPIAALRKVASDYPGTDAAARALLAAAGQSFVQGKVAEAESLFRQFLAECSGNPLTPQAKFGVAACLDAEGKTNEAINAYKEVADRFNGENTSAPARLALGRLYESQGKLEQARDLYLKLAGESAGLIGTEAGDRLTDLFQKRPDLRPHTGALGAPAIAPAAK